MAWAFTPENDTSNRPYIYGISGVYSPYIWSYIGRMYGHCFSILFFCGHCWPYIGYIWPGGASGLYSFIDARDGTAGGRVGGRMSRASMKKKGRASTLESIVPPYMAHI